MSTNVFTPAGRYANGDADADDLCIGDPHCSGGEDSWVHQRDTRGKIGQQVSISQISQSAYPIPRDTPLRTEIEICTFTCDMGQVNFRICEIAVWQQISICKYQTRCKAAFTRDATGSATVARQPRRKYRNIGILQERLHGDTLHAADARLLRARAAI